MKVFRAALLAAACAAPLLLAAVRADDDVEDPDVLVLNKDNFESTIGENDHILVEFYAPWCGHCKRLKPEYAKAATTLKADKIPLAKVDCTAEDAKEICDSNGVQGFPTLKWYSKGSPMDYPGGRTSGDIVEFAKKFSGPAVTDVEDVAAFAKTSKLVIIAIVDGDEKVDVVTEVAESMRNEVRTGKLDKSQMDLVKEHGVDSAPSVLLFADFNEKPIKFDGEFTAEAISEWIKAEQFPLVGEISPENYSAYLGRGLPLAWGFVEPGKEDELIAALTPAATEQKGKLSFVYLDGKEYESHRENLGVTGLPGLVIMNDKEQKFVFDKTFDEAAVKSWVDDVQAGNVEPFLKSEDIPTSNDGPVKVVVGKTFDEIALDTTKDVLVEFYAPWCGHCKKLAPIYDKLGEAFKGKDSVVVAKLDKTANDAAADVKGFPTLIFYPANNKENPITYEGDRSLGDMFKFIVDNASTLSDDDKKNLKAPGDDEDVEEEKDEL